MNNISSEAFRAFEEAKVNILGTEYTIECRDRAIDKALENADGYCDYTSRLIVLANREEKPDSYDNYEVYRNKCLRHEIIHAFLNESGMQENFTHVRYGHEETTVDWIAIQFPKILKVYQELNIL